MILADEKGSIEVRIGDRFVCNLAGGKALMEVCVPYFSRDKKGLLGCKIVTGFLIDAKNQKFVPGMTCDLPGSRVASAVRRYREKASAEGVTP